MLTKDATTRAGDEINAAVGVVHAIENQGSYVKVTLDLANDEEFVAHFPTLSFCAIRSTLATAWWRAGIRMTCICWRTAVAAESLPRRQGCSADVARGQNV